MNWKRVVIYSVVLYVVTFVVAFPFGFIGGYLAAAGKAVPSWLGLAGTITNLFAAIVVYARLGMVQRERTYDHAWAVLIGTSFVSLPINMLLVGQTLFQWIIGIVISIPVLLVGVWIGVKIRRPILDET